MFELPPLHIRQMYVRNRRDDLLKETDWVVAKYTEIGEAIPTAWREYRQALRDISTAEGFDTAPESVQFPTKPEAN